MNKWQVICPVVVIVIAAAAAVVVFGTITAAGDRREIVSAVTHQIDAHSTNIGELLTTMRSSNATMAADAAFQELQSHPYSTSLISREMIKVVRAGDGSLECVIDTSSFGIPSRTIHGRK
jgi:hypothetical protein